MMTKKIILLLLATLLLANCSLLSPVKSEPPKLWVINTLPAKITKTPPRSFTLFIARPLTDSIHNSPQMLYSARSYRVDYFVKNRWAQSPTQMLLPLILQTLQNTHYFAAVSSDPSIGRYDYLLNTQLIEFQQVFKGRASFMQVTLRAQIISMNNGQILATRQFTVLKEAPQPNPYGGVVAANEAVAEILAQLAKFCFREIS
jgi:cholesterol transport system auxiliary component